MSVDIQYKINEFLLENTQFNTNDVLVDVSEENKKLFFTNKLLFDVSEFPKKILSEFKKFKKETGVSTLVKTIGIVELNYNGTIVKTPILLFPLSFSLNKIKSEISFSVDEESAFLNPFLTNFILNSTEKEVPKTIDLDLTLRFLTEIGLQNTKKEIQIIGNFHHHRFQIIKELESLLKQESFNTNLTSLLGFEKSELDRNELVSISNLLPADSDHELVFEALKADNVIVQGPPGTGKSQVLTNVLAKLLHQEKTSIVVSEKRVALEVLVKKLSAFGLDKLCFIASSDKLSHNFLQELSATWDYFEAFEGALKPNLNLSKQYEDNLQMTLDLLSQKELIGGVSFHEFKVLTQGIELDKIPFSNEVPSVENFLENKTVIQTIYQLHLNEIIGHIRPEILSKNNFIDLKNKVVEWQKMLQNILYVASWKDLRNTMKIAADCQVYENELYKKYSSIFKINSRPNKRFLSLRKKYLKLKEEVNQINKNQSHWKITPSETETNNLIQNFSSGGFFTKRKARKRWKEIATVSSEKAIEILENHLLEIAKTNAFSQNIIDFSEIGIENPEVEVQSIYQTLSQYSAEVWFELDKIPLENKRNLTDSHQLLNRLFSDIRAHFSFDEETNITFFLAKLNSNFEAVLSVRKSLSTPSNSLLKLLVHASTFQAYFENIYKGNWVQFKEHFPAFSNFETKTLTSKIEEIISLQNSESELFANEIEAQIKKQFETYHNLLNTPARKLSESDKKKKLTLRKGKAILIKEFSKTRSHPSLRELYNSEARIWIQLLKPIWLSNPSQVSNCFPLEQNIFDLAIFDEASQIPLQNALGTIQRSKQVLIAGDEHQMGPTSYFKKKQSEEIDLLHQANYHFSKVSLKHHYRSSHPDLIAFSNKHFYNNELAVYPAFTSASPINHHFIENGQFIDRKNKEEAKAIAQQIEFFVSGKDTLGVVAFSEEQLNCIWDHLSSQVQQELTIRLDKNEGFFKSLENVQGDECDHLLISFGYAKNEKDEFQMRFGPMNTSNGRKRLNVLLTRAIISIHFYCSIKSTGFKLSDNESLNLLRQWIAFSENYQSKEAITFPYELKVTKNKDLVTFKQIQEKLPKSRELVTLHRALSLRGWKVDYS